MTAGIGPQAGEWRHWPVVMASAAGITLAAVNGYSLGVMMGPLQEEFGWSRAQISVGPLIISLMSFVGAPIVGVAIDRFGPRRIAIIGVLFYCTALALVSNADRDIATWWVHWGILGIGAMLTMSTVWVAAINSFFTRHRGKALAFALCGTGLSAAVTPIATDQLIVAYGWRGAYVGLALLGAILVLPLVLFCFRHARDVASATTQSMVAQEALPGFTARDGFASSSFLKLASAVLLFGVSSIALTVNAVPVLRAEDFDASTAAWLAGLIGIGSVVGRLGGGFLLDRFAAKKVAALAALAPVLSVILLVLFSGSLGAGAAAALLLGLSAGAEVDACAYLGARHFGMRSFGTLFGTINGLVLFGAGVAPLAANYVFDLTGSYDFMLYSIMPIGVVAATLFLSLGPYPDWTVDPMGRGIATPDSSKAAIPAGG